MSITFDISPDGGERVHKIGDAGFDFTEDTSNEQTCLKGAFLLQNGRYPRMPMRPFPVKKVLSSKLSFVLFVVSSNLPRLKLCLDA